MDALDPSEVEHLYSEPLDRFIDARTELVKRLREQGSGDAAAEAGRLRKPTVPAWAVDQLARLAPEDLGALFEANERLRAAQAGGKRSGGREAFRAAAQDRQRLVGRLTDAAGEILRAAGHGDARATMDRVAATLLATAADDGGAELVRRGALVHELGAEDLGGFGLLLGAPEAGEEPSEPGSPRRDAKARRGAQDRRKKIDAAERQAERLKAAAEEATAIARAAADHAAEAERAAAALRRDADKAGREARRARAKADDALAELGRLTGSG